MSIIEGTAVRVDEQDQRIAEVAGADDFAKVIPDNTLVKVYLRMRNAKSAEVHAFEKHVKDKYDTPMLALETEFKKRMQERGSSGLRTDEGTVYLSESIKVSCGDWGVFHGWIKQHDALDFLEQRVKSGEVKKYMEDNNGELPPGLTVHRELEARVRAPTKRGEKAVEGDSP